MLDNILLHQFFMLFCGYMVGTALTFFVIWVVLAFMYGRKS